ncbi:UDP-N-acetylglucosamine 1-carboxyvinyltransferase [Enterobacteriaceae endosymbiont of Macroplea mutica]|uniref:UDP-N-acetylglucosamine 1-carboxyvinyltransferase n=1 Tax=Enterobacteriaceae endosymbiont of Macroplea mutica TaxID=2675791 RepID=UPI00144A0DF1|nr:UDP-N-acetylglucosamine 1-carboxyvinyltransferase [Enterobacteriaceae endosymbiont of Macroplea mutica]QJC31442.1 UDP-N-acetylglucosamine 1-carboxyvinyltransferase [Enterobacteriaceae endosymbiont of Macroplea mutica]
MDKLIIKGPVKLQGKVRISGAKNAALPILLSTILLNGTISINNIPYIKDINVAIKLLQCLGAKIKKGKLLYLDTRNLKNSLLPERFITVIRASVWIISPLLVRFGKFRMFYPGGCAIGKRPIDLHIKYLYQLGAVIKEKKNYIIGYIPDAIIGTHIIMDKISVGATISTILLAIFAKGITIIDNPAKEPEIQDLSNFLNFMGARIYGAGTNRITINGIQYLNNKNKIYTIIPDRIETGTFLVAAAMSKSKIICEHTNPQHLTVVLEKLKDTGANIQIGSNWCSLDMNNKTPKAVNIITGPYPNFPTDMQTLFTVLNTVSCGVSNITETIFENRFLHIFELQKMGAEILLKNNKIMYISGKKMLKGTQVIATDLRASISLVLAGCHAIGTTIIHNINYIDRGYENIEQKLLLLGAKTKRIKI